MNNRELRLKIKALGEGKILPSEPYQGLCRYLAEDAEASTVQNKVIQHLMTTWSGFSGKAKYPVSHPRENPSIAFASESNFWEPKATRNKADKEYAENRLRMCRYIARKLAQLDDWK